jgi:hypothetical protein
VSEDETPCCVHATPIGVRCPACDGVVGTVFPDGGVAVGQVWRSRGAPFAFHVVLMIVGDDYVLACMEGSSRARIARCFKSFLFEEFWFTGEVHDVALSARFRSRSVKAPIINVVLSGDGLDEQLNGEIGLALRGWAQAAAWLRTPLARQALATHMLVTDNALELIAQALEANIGAR